MSMLEKLKGLLDGEPIADRLDRPNLRRQVVEGILALKRRGQRGAEVLPPAVAVRVTVGEGGVEVVRGFVKDPTFDQEVEAALRNRLVNAQSLPLRSYAVEAGPKTRVHVAESELPPLGLLRVSGGDADGREWRIPADTVELRLGRGQRHGETSLDNDIVLSENDRFVSRRAAVLRRSGGALEVEALDQQEFLVLVKPDGKRIRPRNTRTGKVRIDVGDVLEFSDGKEAKISLHFLAPEPPDAAAAPGEERP